MEHASVPLPVPPIVRMLIAKVLAGDLNAAGLLGTPSHQLVPSPGQGPTAIKAEYFRYTYANWTRLRTHGEWWSRTPIPGDEPRLFLKALDGDPGHAVSTCAHRHWVLWFAVVGVALSLELALRMVLGGIYETPRCCMHWRIMGLVVGTFLTSAGCFVLGLTVDYPQVFEWAFETGGMVQYQMANVMCKAVLTLVVAGASAPLLGGSQLLLGSAEGHVNGNCGALPPWLIWVLVVVLLCLAFTTQCCASFQPGTVAVA